MVLMGLPHMVLILKLMLSFGAISVRMFVTQLALPQIKIHQKFACLHDWVNGLFFGVQCTWWEISSKDIEHLELTSA